MRNDLRRTICAHFIHAERGHIHTEIIEHAPSVGDEVRFYDDKFYSVVRKVWVYDEPDHPRTRLNIEIEDITP